MIGPRRGPAVERNMPVVLRALVKGPRTGTDLRDALAAFCEGADRKKAVSDALQHAKSDGLVRFDGTTWKLTDAGQQEAARLLAERGKARAA